MELTTANLAQWNISRGRLELPDTDSRGRLEAVAKEFESLFAKQMLDSMRATLNPEEDMFNGGMAQDIFEDMLYDEYARVLSKTGGLGIAEMIIQQYASTTTDAADVSTDRAAAAYEGV
jgi:peptidoglycan hydrolase FlgJ